MMLSCLNVSWRGSVVEGWRFGVEVAVGMAGSHVASHDSNLLPRSKGEFTSKDDSAT
jgi:hypothetical protein